MKVTEAVVLAGGLGTRIRSTLGDLPKALADVHGKTLIERKLDELCANGITRAHVLTGIGHEQMSESLRTYRNSYPAIEILEYFDGDQPLGTGGAVLKVLSTLPSLFFLTYGDSLLDLNYCSLKESIQQTGLPHAISTTTTPGKSDRLNCLVSNQRLVKYDKSGGPEMNSTDYGVLLFSSQCLAAEIADETIPFDLALIISRLAVQRQMSAVLTEKKYLEIGTPQSLREVREHFRIAAE